MPRPLPPEVQASTEGMPDAVANHILDAAHRVIARDGLAAASTRGIAEEAGLSVGALYNYFEDRTDLVVAALMRQAHLSTGPLHELPSRAGTATVVDNLQQAAREISDILDRIVPLFGAVFSDPHLLTGLRRVLSEHVPAFSDPQSPHPLGQYLAAERALGRIVADADCESAAAIVLSLCHEAAFFRFFHGSASSVAPIARSVEFIADALTGQAPSDTAKEY